ncbi:MAG: hypothetical protein ACLP0J_04860 [Solirubrobacteraceae bacterium]
MAELNDDELRLDAETIYNLVSWAWGSVEPAALARFNVREAPVGDDCVVSFLDQMFVLRFGPGLHPGSEVGTESIITSIVGAYALLEGIAFDWSFAGGMDLEGARWNDIRYFKWLGRHESRLPGHDSP